MRIKAGTFRMMFIDIGALNGQNIPKSRNIVTGLRTCGISA